MLINTALDRISVFQVTSSGNQGMGRKGNKWKKFQNVLPGGVSFLEGGC